MISFIVAYDRNKGIGKDNKLPWHYPADLQYFKETTMGKTVAMGSKTFASIGQALPGRKNIVFTQHPQHFAKVADEANIVINTDPLAFFKKEQNSPEETFVIGGSEIFTLALPYTTRLYITEIDKEFPVDTYFPDIDLSQFIKKSSKSSGELTFVIYEKEHTSL